MVIFVDAKPSGMSHGRSSGRPAEGLVEVDEATWSGMYGLGDPTNRVDEVSHKLYLPTKSGGRGPAPVVLGQFLGDLIVWLRASDTFGVPRNANLDSIFRLASSLSEIVFDSSTPAQRKRFLRNVREGMDVQREPPRRLNQLTWMAYRTGFSAEEIAAEWPVPNAEHVRRVAEAAMRE